MHNHLERINNCLQAMDIEEADNTVLSSPVSLNPMVCHQNGVFSLEDLAWVDSCLNKDSDISESDWTPLRDALPDISESDWTPLRDALPDIVSSQSQSFRVDARQNNQTHHYRKGKNITSPHIQESSTSNANCLQNVANQTSTDKILEDELAGTTFQGDPFLPTYNEDLKPTYEMEHASENIFKAWNLNCANDEMEEASENIFKVWDLDIPVEEGELVKQLKKALSVLDDSEKGKDLKEGSHDNLIAGNDLNEGPLDNLIAAIADLSLDKKV
ncbi:unnamed protein product [Vicia faba]|uniref:Uncharacterized protein n=1 Tax=Vicia faba TaxID=3906 RepID=A0AAV1A9A1_VICFA|nr:unnamed protein product [Vicia faba]